MTVRTHREPLLTLESVALTDIILNIFIFFFTSFSLLYTFAPAREARIAIRLPQAEAGTSAARMGSLTVTLTGGGALYLDGNAVSEEGLRTALAAAARLDPTRQVAVRADKDVFFDRVVRVLDAVKKAGLDRVGIAVEAAGRKGSPIP
jgi:biopolymer transport protein ExbD